MIKISAYEQNEQTIGTDFSKLTDEMFAKIEWKLNHRPRKSLGYRTPPEYCKQLFTLTFEVYCTSNQNSPHSGQHNQAFISSERKTK